MSTRSRQTRHRPRQLRGCGSRHLGPVQATALVRFSRLECRRAVAIHLMAKRGWFVPALIGVFALFCTAYSLLLGARVASGENDFLAFHTGAKLAMSGQLYDLPEHLKVHQATVGREYPSLAYIRFPYYAGLLQPLGWLPLRWAWPMWAIFQGLCGCWILWLFGRGDREYLFIMMLLPALYTSTMSGQDTLLLAAMLTGVWMLLEKRMDAPAGALLALALIKPHFALVFAMVLLVRGRWRALSSFAGSAIILYFASAAMAGLDWPVHWMRALQPIMATDKRHIMPNALNLLEGVGVQSGIAWLAFAVHSRRFSGLVRTSEPGHGQGLRVCGDRGDPDGAPCLHTGPGPARAGIRVAGIAGPLAACAAGPDSSHVVLSTPASTGTALFNSHTDRPAGSSIGDQPDRAAEAGGDYQTLRRRLPCPGFSKGPALGFDTLRALPK